MLVNNASAPDLSKPAGNEVHISVCTDTEYEKRDGANHFGLKCQAVGYEWTSNPAEVREPLMNKASVCMCYRKIFFKSLQICSHKILAEFSISLI